MTWLGVGGVILVYATKWKVVMKRIPYIRGQFEDEVQVEEESWLKRLYNIYVSIYVNLLYMGRTVFDA